MTSQWDATSHWAEWPSLTHQKTGAGDDEENMEPIPWSVGMQISAAPVENNMKFSQKTKNGTAFWSSDSTAGIIS